MSLQKIQAELKVPKGQTNNFGKYKYRSCEDILEAAKPVLAKYEAHIIISDEIKLVGERYYIEATANLYVDGQLLTYVKGWAREPLEKKGMDASQITGTASSYARKYALNGLLAIDDTKDADTDEHSNQVKEQPKRRVNKEQVQDYVNLFLDAIAADDGLACLQYGDELKGSAEHDAVWQALTTKQKDAVKKLCFNTKREEKK